jgi:hypothetical protein
MQPQVELNYVNILGLLTLVGAFFFSVGGPCCYMEVKCWASCAHGTGLPAG